MNSLEWIYNDDIVVNKWDLLKSYLEAKSEWSRKTNGLSRPWIIYHEPDLNVDMLIEWGFEEDVDFMTQAKYVRMKHTLRMKQALDLPIIIADDNRKVWIDFPR